VITETNAVTFRQNLGEMLNIVQYRNDSVLIKKDGKPVAALIDARLFERIRRMQERFDALCDRLAKTYEGVPEAVARAEIEEATTHARRETADAWRAAGRLPPLPATPKPLHKPKAKPAATARRTGNKVEAAAKAVPAAGKPGTRSKRGRTITA
jgi:prevent-host-death family protein